MVADERTRSEAGYHSTRMDRQPEHSRASVRSPLVAACALSAAVAGLTIGGLGPVLPTLHERLHVPLGSLGVLFAANFIGSLAATILIGPLFDRRQPRPFLLLGLGLVFCGLALLALATSLQGVAIGAALTGVGGGASALGATVLTARALGARAGRALSLVNMSFGLGAFVGPLAVAALSGATHQYRPYFIAICAFLLLPLGILARTPLPGPVAQGARRSGALGGSERLAVVLLALVTFCYLGAEIGFGGWIYSYVLQTSTANATTASWAPAAYWLALALSSLGAALRPRAWGGEYVVLYAAIGACAMSLVVLAGRGSSGVEIAAAAGVGLALGPIYPLSVAGAALVAPAAAGRVSALVIASSQLGGALLPWLQGLLLARGPLWGLGLTLVACLAMVALQAGLIGLLRPRSAKSGH